MIYLIQRLDHICERLEFCYYYFSLRVPSAMRSHKARSSGVWPQMTELPMLKGARLSMSSFWQNSSRAGIYMLSINRQVGR